MEGTDEDCF
jgi:hypothetical protein